MATHPSNSTLTGILLLLVGCQIVPLMDAFAKLLATDYPILQIVWARFFFHFLFILPVVLWRYGRSFLRQPHLWLQLLRGGFLVGATFCFFTALKHLPLADTLAISFVSPMLVTLLSPFVLGETVGWRRLSAVAVSFLGALVIVRPGFAEIGIGVLGALGSAFCYACYVLATRKLAGTAPPLVTLAYTSVVGCLVLSGIMLGGGPAVWRTPDLEGLVLMAGVGLVAVVGHFLVIRAYDHAEASLLSPFNYSEMIAAAALGYFVFNEFPDAWTWLGIAIIVASGIYIALRERARHAARAVVQAAEPL
jgi:drug/metabolite transporter (DMT)-like permease